MSSQRREVRPAITFCCATLQRELTTLKSGRECAGASHRPQSRASDPPDLETRHHRKYSSEEVPSGSELVILSGSGVGQHSRPCSAFQTRRLWVSSQSQSRLIQRLATNSENPNDEERSRHPHLFKASLDATKSKLGSEQDRHKFLASRRVLCSFTQKSLHLGALSVRRRVTIFFALFCVVTEDTTSHNSISFQRFPQS